MRVATLAALIVMMVGSSAGRAAADDTVVPVRILDYTSIPAKAVAKAQRRVSNLYRRAGVRTRWAETLRPAEPAARPRQSIDPQELFVIILTPGMSRRLEVRESVVGMAAVTVAEGGRVAYILFDRVWNVAHRARLDTMEVLSLVIAHELGHLLLPRGSHSPDGLMRGLWTLNDLRDRTHRGFEVTDPQAALIRGMLERRVGSPVD